LTPAAEALAHSIATSGVTIRASAAPFKSTDKEAVISLAVEVDTGAREAAAVSGMPDGEIEIVYTAVDARNRAFPGGGHKVPTSSARPSRTFPGTSVQLASALTLPPGQYQLRIAASVAGRTGTLSMTSKFRISTNRH
jgi:hypothetical protein